MPIFWLTGSYIWQFWILLSVSFSPHYVLKIGEASYRTCYSHVTYWLFLHCFVLLFSWCSRKHSKQIFMHRHAVYIRLINDTLYSILFWIVINLIWSIILFLCILCNYFDIFGALFAAIFQNNFSRTHRYPLS